LSESASGHQEVERWGLLAFEIVLFYFQLTEMTTEKQKGGACDTRGAPKSATRPDKKGNG
jgi:hypothetical protein